MSNNNDISRSNTSRLNWRSFTTKSDEKYRAVLNGQEFSDLEAHNIIRGCDKEIQFIFDCSELFLYPIQPGPALDVCCGAGSMSSALAYNGFDVTGIDLNEDAILLAQKRYPECRFLVGDATEAPKMLLGRKFNLILFREAHPFSRISDFEFQMNLLDSYRSMLNPRGILVVAHARTGGGTEYPSLDFARVKRALKARKDMEAGPFFFFLLKHFHCRAKNKLLVRFFSLCTAALHHLIGGRWIEFWFVTTDV